MSSRKVGGRYAGFSWRWNHSDNPDCKHIFILHDETQTELVNRIWSAMPGVPFDWGGNTPWLDRLLNCEMLPAGSSELAQLLSFALGDYEQAVVLMLYGAAPAPRKQINQYLKTVQSFCGNARVVWASRGTGMGWACEAAVECGLEALDMSALPRDRCAGLIRELFAEELKVAGKPSRLEPWVREEAEWTHVSFDRDTAGCPAVLLVGDSISNGYAGRVRELLDGTAMVDCLQTSEGTACPKYVRMLDFMLDRREYRAVHLNVGIHLHGVTPEEYEAQLQTILTHIQRRSAAKVIFATTTPTHCADDVTKVDPLQTELFAQYNQRAVAVCARLGIGTDDLFAVSLENGLPMVDRHHFAPSGYDRLAAAVAESIGSAL